MRLFLVLLALALALALPASAQGVLAVRADTLYTMAGPAIVDAVVVVRDGRIAEVGPASRVRIPAGARTLQASVVTPGLVDIRGTVGLSGLLNQPQEQDATDEGAAVSPSLRALDAYNARDELVEWLLTHGVTTVQTGHAPGPLAAGQTVVVKTAYESVDEAIVDSTAMLAMTLGTGATDRDGGPGSRSRAVADLRSALYEAVDYDRKRSGAAGSSRPSRDLDKEVLADVALGRMPALLTAHRAADILTVLRLQREFPQMRLVLDGAAEAYLVIDALREAGVAVALHPTMIRAGGEGENASFETARTLYEAGIPFAIQSGYEAYVPKTRVVLFEAGMAAAYGLPREAALAAVTRGPAEILGLADRIGTVEVGKDADLALFDGDPLETMTHVCGVIVDGRVASETCR